MNITLHRAGLNDLDLVLRLVSAYHEFERLGSTACERESAVRKLLMNPDLGGIWLINSDGETAGYIVLCRGYSIEFNGFDAFVDEFFLDIEFRGRGVGSQALMLIQQEAAKLEINALHLEVAKDNEAAQKLYRKAGFEARQKYLLMSVKLPGEE